jgi:thiaminase
MPKARQVIDEVKRELQEVENKICQHPYLKALENGQIKKDKLKLFVGEQSHIIRSDLCSVALLLSRYGLSPSRDFFWMVLQGEKAALEAVSLLAHALQMTPEELANYEPKAGAYAYTAYMAWMALYASDAEVAAAYLVNFTAWGDNCARMEKALQEKYRLTGMDLVFFSIFSTPPEDFEAKALAVVEAGLSRGVEVRLIRRAARLLQNYELMYWDTLYSLSTID